mmetsp:Transcript_55825/g.92348  ORF Transcript_55825/g.92348 Transcript_55825/m.92348 type:complete len:127 (-) Transcript_55825:987-1367(-)
MLLLEAAPQFATPVGCSQPTDGRIVELAATCQNSLRVEVHVPRLGQQQMFDLSRAVIRQGSNVVLEALSYGTFGSKADATRLQLSSAAVFERQIMINGRVHHGSNSMNFFPAQWIFELAMVRYKTS